MAKRNPAYGYWSEEETNWSEKDDIMLVNLRRENPELVPTSLKELKELHESQYSKTDNTYGQK